MKLALKNSWRTLARGLRLARSRAIALIVSRKTVADTYIDAVFQLERAREKENDANERVKAIELVLSSARATITDREREIAQLNLEKAQLEAAVALRKYEIEELNRWIERQRCRINADIAEEVAREYQAVNTATNGPRKPG